MNIKKKAHTLAKTIVENGFYDRDTNSLFISNPGISFDVLKGLARKRNFTVGQTASGEFVSIPLSKKYTGDGKGLSLYDDFLDTYTLYNGNYENLKLAYATFDMMDENLAEVGLMLNTYVAEVLGQGFISNPIKVKIDRADAQSLVERILYKNKIYQRLPNLVRSVAKYGNYGLCLTYPNLENMINNVAEKETATLPAINVEEDLFIDFINPKYFKVNTDEYFNPINYETEVRNNFAATNAVSMITSKVWQPWQFVHFKLYDEITEPYGKSMLWSMRSSFDQLTSLEALLAISRASKIQRLVFYIPVPNGTNYLDTYSYINEFKANYLNSMFTDQGSQKSGRKIPGAMSILTLPKSDDGDKVEVDHIESNIDLSSVEDVEYFLDKILRNSNLPKGYLVGDDVITTAQTLEAQDLKLKRALIPLKQAVVNGLMELVENILTHCGYDVSKLNVEVGLNEPIQISSDTIAKYNDIGELLGTFMEINKEMPDINKFQFLVKMGMPSELASLVSSKDSINVLGTSDELACFLKNQQVRIKDHTMSTDVEESCTISAKSRVFLAEHTNLAKNLKEFYLQHKDSSYDKKLLTESLYLSEDKDSE